MTAHLLLITLGPVQEFIAEARRTRDLWYGSHLLSELGRAAARALCAGGAKLIFPALASGDPELEPCLAPLRGDHPPQNIANKLLAEVPAGQDPKALAQSVRTMIFDFWRTDIANPVHRKCAELLAPNTEAVWSEQIDKFLEFGAVWLPLTTYQETRAQLEMAMGGRKALRDFEPWLQLRGDVPKSSLDGARETVLKPPESRPEALTRRFRIPDGEQLDAVGLVKRAGGEPEQFVPLVNVALASWIAEAGKVAPQRLLDLSGQCRQRRVGRIDRPDLAWVRTFPFDASVFLRGRWTADLFEDQPSECQSRTERREADAAARQWGHNHVLPLLRILGDPHPYIACLVADGDRMGAAIERLDTPEKHRQMSRDLAGFAALARRIVEADHRGSLVYAGGDDVLAFVPLPEALACAEALRNAFAKALELACSGIEQSLCPTLSVGLGVGHLMESMGDLLALGRAAEREAKRDRNSLALIIDKRSGGQRAYRSSWVEDPVRQIRQAIEGQGDHLSSRKVYEIGAILRRLPEPHPSLGMEWAEMLGGEVRRSLSRVEGGALKPEEMGLVLDAREGYGALHRSIDSWVQRLLIARTFAEASSFQRGRQGVSA